MNQAELLELYDCSDDYDYNNIDGLCWDSDDYDSGSYYEVEFEIIPNSDTSKHSFSIIISDLNYESGFIYTEFNDVVEAIVEKIEDNFVLTS